MAIGRVQRFLRAEIVLAIAITFLGLLGWKIMIVDLWLTQTEEYRASAVSEKSTYPPSR
jgi:hypothetical protein